MSRTKSATTTQKRVPFAYAVLDVSATLVPLLGAGAAGMFLIVGTQSIGPGAAFAGSLGTLVGTLILGAFCRVAVDTGLHARDASRILRED